MKPPRHYECRYILTHGREYCTTDCPICSRAKSLYKVKDSLVSDSFSGSAPTVFVGKFGYPNVNLGIMAPPEIRGDAWTLDAPKNWAKNNYTISKLVELRSSLINSRTSVPVKSSGKYVQIGQEVAMAEKSAELEIDLKHKPSFRMTFQTDLAPTGPSASLKKARITSNTKIPHKVDKVFSDTDLHANNAINNLYKTGFDENYLSSLLSAGILGVKVQRKLVPTRWSITATDDSIGKTLISSVKKFNQSDFLVWFGGYLGNYFVVIALPDVWRYELFELYVASDKPLPSNKVPYTTDFEDYSGRKSYANETAGGYYASRLAVLEELMNRKRQASALVIRFITDEYSAPLGVWVVREAVRKAMSSKPIEFASEELLFGYVGQLAKNKFSYDISYIKKRSHLFKEFKIQNKLTSYF